MLVLCLAYGTVSYSSSTEFLPQKNYSFPKTSTNLHYCLISSEVRKNADISIWFK